ncbi:hypothetical protein [Aurantiacibacter rhizosphaerae]|uniref:hypothetical protein n=1 Tax=Aurantiacibacter rhizosphaerae TaxID=2691582 RepID=UPI0019245FFD|nr:hypothetical protein [Aurantiacibacter rhizosphaerae]
MIRKPTRFASFAALAAALSMAATPVAGAEMPASASPANAHVSVNTGDPGEANQYRRYRRDRYRGYRHRNRGVDAGDVVAGVVVLGALAAIIGSSNKDRDRDYRYDRRDRVRYDDRRDRNHGNYESSGVESAVDMCVDQVEYADKRVENVDEAQRSASGWNVSGTLSTGQSWRCFIDNGGEIRSIDYSTGAYTEVLSEASGSQHSDAAYRNARARTRTAADEVYSYDDAAPVATVPGGSDARPAYPGGPLPGEEGYAEDWQPDADADTQDGEWEGDGRYTTAQAPDFAQPAR